MNENLILQIKQIENKIERLEIQRDFYKELVKRKGKSASTESITE